MRILGLIPARGNSKGVPRKNARLLHGKPLLQYTVESAVACGRLAKIVLSTDDDEIADIGRRLGIDVPFRRPAELSADTTPMLPVIQHAIGWLEAQGDTFDAVCLLQPTNPLRRASDIVACLDLLERSGADAVTTVLKVPAEYNPHWAYFANAEGCLQLSTGEREPIGRRQDLPQAFHREGSVYVTRRDVIMLTNSLYGERLLGFLMDEARSVNINNADDWERAERLVAAVGAPAVMELAD